MSLFGTSRRFAAARRFGRCWGEADVPGVTRGRSDADHPGADMGSASDRSIVRRHAGDPVRRRGSANRSLSTAAPAPPPGVVGSLDDQNQGREPADREDQERDPPDGEDAKPQNGFCCSRTGRAGRGIVRTSCFFAGWFACSVKPLFAVSGAGSARARIGSASDGVGGTHGEFAS